MSAYIGLHPVAPTLYPSSIHTQNYTWMEKEWKQVNFNGLAVQIDVLTAF